MKRLISSFLSAAFACAALSLAGCDLGRVVGLGGDAEVSLFEQTYLFEVEYVNYAWVPTWRGVYVDGTGGVYRFDRAGEAWEPAGRDAFTAAELTAKYAPGRARIDTVDAETLDERAGQIVAARRGPLSDPSHLCADAGTLTFRAFVLDEDGLYHPVLLYQSGDRAQENRSAAARVLVEWLRTLAPEFSDYELCAP